MSCMKRSIVTSLTMLLVILQAWGAMAEVVVSAAVERQSVYVGESFIYQIQVDGSDSPSEPDLSALHSNFTVTPGGGRQNNSQSVTIINGKIDRVSHVGYTFNYSLTPLKAGHLVVPPIAVEVDGRQYRTNQLTIVANKPQETVDFKLRVSLEKEAIYVGEPIRMTVTWYIGKDVNDFKFTLPLLNDPRFALYDTAEKNDHSDPSTLLRIPLGTDEVIGVKSNGDLDGKNYLTVTFSKILIAKEAGTFTLPEMTVACKALAGFSNNQRRDPFGDMFGGSFFGRSREVYQTVVVPSNQPALKVSELPKQGRPAHFTGLVGSYSIAATATPTDVKVGDPITLTIQVAGPYVNEFVLPDLRRQLAETDFKIPEEMAPGEVKDGVLKSFTQTIRAKHSGVTQLPGIALSYFNSESGHYEETRSQPIPLKVSAARLVTSHDAEGQVLPGMPVKRELRAAKTGIRYNYDGPEVLKNVRPTHDNEQDRMMWLVLLGVPPLLFFAVFLSVQIRHLKEQNPQQKKARKAYSRCREALQDLRKSSDVSGEQYEKLAQILCLYLGAKLQVNASAITFADVKPTLVSKGVPDPCLTGLQEIIARCEAQRYAGSAGGAGSVDAVLDRATQVVSELEKIL